MRFGDDGFELKGVIPPLRRHAVGEDSAAPGAEFVAADDEEEDDEACTVVELLPMGARAGLQAAGFVVVNRPVARLPPPISQVGRPVDSERATGRIDHRPNSIEGEASSAATKAPSLRSWAYRSSIGGASIGCLVAVGFLYQLTHNDDPALTSSREQRPSRAKSLAKQSHPKPRVAESSPVVEASWAIEEPVSSAVRRRPILSEAGVEDLPRPEVLAAYVPEVLDGTLAPVLRALDELHGATDPGERGDDSETVEDDVLAEDDAFAEDDALAGGDTDSNSVFDPGGEAAFDDAGSEPEVE